MLQMKFHPRFIEAFHSDQKITSLRMMQFKCFRSDREDKKEYFHDDTLTKNIIIPDYSADATMWFSKGARFTHISDFAGLLKRQPYKRGDEIELVTEAEGGEIAPFATATIIGLSVVKGEEIDRIDAIHDGFNPDRDPLAELHTFMRSVYHTADPVKEMYWLYTFIDVQMLPQWGGEA
ncbi:hypothetical protein [Salmonella enterica]|uniref:ASCH domain-containing protein n=1 Tax=Salmonella enterica I TaxID=59201 RepID=A0A7Z1SUN2_SALET|nr:hypothetical protein [Salmonella enterica]OHK35263.1 hypothetical protein A7S73_25635 [Salmonella enterica subsp. enterica serovar Mbandaka]OHK61895.1 hypothetical protein A7S80_25685 [Salmonella enterica subsp. enterica serovar Mbandaka]PTU33335.1 hypothetical protein DBZ43_29780 [Salmonella enterica subsp. enterica]